MSAEVETRLEAIRLRRRVEELEAELAQYDAAVSDEGEKLDIVSLLRLWEKAGKPREDDLRLMHMSLAESEPSSSKFAGQGYVPIFIREATRERMYKETSGNYSDVLERLLDLAQNTELVRRADRMAEDMRRMHDGKLLPVDDTIMFLLDESHDAESVSD